jgi:outer membrane immunogenic protein
MKTILIAATTAMLIAPATAQAEMFSGAYGGLETGWEKTDGDLSHGITYGGLLGYNAKIGTNGVVGLEGKLGFSTADDTTTVGGVTSKLGAGRSLGIAGRAGYLAAPNTLFYGKLGYENIRTKLEFEPDPTDLSDAFNVDAVTVGGGVEFGFNERTSFRIGYDYANGESSYKRHQIKAGVAFHF